MARRTWIHATIFAVVLAGVLALPAVASAAYTNADCVSCHDSALGAVAAQKFGVGAVDFSTACKKCHDDSLAGTHPYHNPTANCGASCHPGWGESLVSAVPSHLDARGYGAFAAANSADTDPAILHIIHSKPRWMESKDSSFSRCGSCHAVATCDSCHDNAPAPDDATHLNHGTGVTPWIGNTSSGVTAGNQLEDTYVLNNAVTCGATGCHDTAGVASSAPGYLDDKSHIADTASGYLTNTVTKTPTTAWRVVFSNAYTLGQISQSNVTNATFSVPFTGEQIILVSDKDPYRGIAEVIIDGVSRGTVDLYKDTTVNQVEVYKSPILSAGAHTITIKATGTKNPAARANYVRVDGFKVYNRAVGKVAPACTSCHPSNAGSHGMGVFSHVATGTASGMLSGSRCDSCHEMSFIGEHNRGTSSSVGRGCGNCHTTYAPSTWTGTWNTASGCAYTTCHQAATPRAQHTAMAASHVVTNDPAEALCRGCHAGDLAVIHSNSVAGSVVTNCNTCHSVSSVPSSKSCLDAACHAGTGVTSLDAHNFNTTKHASSPWTSAYQGAAPSVSTGGKECSVCHSARLDIAHATTSMGAISCTSGGTGSTGCHNNTSLSSQTVAIGNYSQKRCTQCHNSGGNVSHDNTATPHAVSAGTCAGTAGGCHASTDLWALHAKSQGGGAPTGASCANAGCHSVANLNKRPTQKTCGQGNACHTTMELGMHPGSHNHSYSSASDYNAGTGTGCANSGAGCHGTDAARADMVTPYHSSSGCTSGACHTSSSKAAYGGSNECASCHDGNYNGAPDRVGLSADFPNGHYNEATHTATGMDVEIDGGVYDFASTCSSCHSASLKSAHATDTLVMDSGRPAWTAPYCVNCHNAETPEADSVATIKADSWSSRTCDQCHVTNGNGKHTTYTPEQHNASTGLNGCLCHDTKDVRLIHDTVTANSGCTASGPDSKGFANPGCHDLDKPMDTTPMSCGVGALGCHQQHNDYNHGAAHTLIPSAYNNTTVTGCTGAGDGCHGEADDLTYTSMEYHPIGGDPNNVAGCTASICHNSPDRTKFAITDAIACLDCHAGNYAGGRAVSNLMALETNGGHYVQAPHQATNGANTLSAGGTSSATCNDCHSSDRALTGLFSQHQAINAAVTPGSVTNSFADGFEAGSFSSWTTADYQPASSGSVTYINEGFESGAFTTNAWTSTTGAIANATAQKRTGTYAASLQAASSSTTLVRFQKTFDLSGATGNSTLSFWYRIPVAMNFNDVFRAGWSTDGGTTWTYGVNRTTPGVTAWTNIVMNNVPYTSNVIIKFELAPRSSTTRNYIYIDDITLTNTAAAVAEGGWKVQSATKKTGTYGAQSIGGGSVTRYLTKTGLNNTGADSVSVDYAMSYASLEAADSLTVQTYDGIAWTTRRTYNLTAVNNMAWTNESITGLPANTTGVRIALKGDTADDLVYLDDFAVRKVVDDIVVGGITLTCYECHNKNASTVSLTKSNALGGTAWNGQCTQCHNGAGGIAAASHLTSIPVATASSTQGCATGGAGCHVSNLHTIHKGDGVGADPACSNCHLYAQQGLTPTGTTCGSGGACHQSHTSVSHNGLTGDDTTHTATAMTTKIDGTTYDAGGGNTCSSCHSSGLKTAHTTKAGWTTPYCLDCHNSTTPVDSVTTIKTDSWNAQTCDQCHVTNGNGKHDTYTTASHTATTGANTCATTGCHATLDVRTLHNKLTRGCTSSGADSKGVVAACHALNKQMIAAPKCGSGTGGCHTSHTGSNHGGSAGGMTCYTCHTSYQASMEDGLGTKTGASRSTSVHHVMGSATQEGDIAPNAGAYPTSQTDVYCVSCHSDHNYFNANRGANLRSDITNASGAAPVNTDFSATAPYGICVSCHSTAKAKQGMGTDQLNVGGANAPVIGGAAFNGSAHNYTVGSTFSASAFNANCSKCHNDEQAKQYQTSTNKFGTHFSATAGILGALGVSLADAYVEEDECYSCHSLAASGRKTTNNFDWYGGRAMNATSQNLFGLFALTYRHNVAGYTGLHKPSPTDETQAYISANKHVECADCHGVHAAQTGRHTQGATTLSGALSGATGVTATFSGANWTAPTAYTQTTAPTAEYQICFKCHSGANTNVATWGGTGAASWTNQGLEFSTANQSYHPVVAGLPVTDPGATGSSRLQAADMRAAFTGADGASYGGWTIGSQMYCSDCHAQSNAGSLGPHGSAVKWMLKGPNQAWPYATAAANGTNATTGFRQYSTRDTGLDTSDGLFCRNCHVLNGTEHTRTDHNLPCVGCHIRVPHGGKVSRLLAATGSTTVYPNTLPARYSANGAGTPYAAGRWVAGFTKSTTGAYSTASCGFAGCTGDHPYNAASQEEW